MSQTTVTEPNDPRAKRYGAGQHPVKRDQILDGAHRVFSRLGFDAAGMADITREAGVSKGTIYVYFEGKDDLFTALMEREREVIFANVAAALNQPGTVHDRLHAYGSTLARLLCSSPVIQAHRVIIGVAERKPDLAAEFYAKGAMRGMALLGGFLAREVATGGLRDCANDLAAQQFVELCLAGLFRPRLFGHMPMAPSDEQIKHNVDSAVMMFLAAYSTETHRRDDL